MYFFLAFPFFQLQYLVFPLGAILLHLNPCLQVNLTPDSKGGQMLQVPPVRDGCKILVKPNTSKQSGS